MEDKLNLFRLKHLCGICKKDDMIYSMWKHVGQSVAIEFALLWVLLSYYYDDDLSFKSQV